MITKNLSYNQHSPAEGESSCVLLTNWFFMVNWSFSGEVTARSSQGGFVTWWKGSCHWYSHTERFLHCCWARAASQGILPEDSPRLLPRECSHQHPWFSEPGSAFTPSSPMAALISDSIFRYWPLELLRCCNWWGAENFPSHLFSDYFFPLPDSWRGSGYVVQLGVRIRDCSFKLGIKSLLSAHFLSHWISLCFSFALLRTWLWKMWSPSVSSSSEGSELCSFTASAGSFHFPARFFGNPGVGRPWMLTLHHLALLTYLWQH